MALIRTNPFRDGRGSMVEHQRTGHRWDSVALVKNRRRLTRRGLHFQLAPRQQAKLVICVRGAIRDVFLDLRRDSPTRGRWGSVSLKENDGCALCLPKGFAHGYETRTADAWVLYAFRGKFSPRHRRQLPWASLGSRRGSR